MAFSPRSDVLASGNFSEVKLWDTTTWREEKTLSEARFPALFSPDGQWLVTSVEGGFRVWNTDTWEPAGSFGGEPEFGRWHRRHVMAFSPDGELLLTPRDRDELEGNQFQVQADPILVCDVLISIYAPLKRGIKTVASL